MPTPLYVGQVNTETTTTTLQFSAPTGLEIQGSGSTNGLRSEIVDAVVGEGSTGTAIIGSASWGTAVLGRSAAGVGVFGASEVNIGVSGQSGNSAGLLGRSNSGPGVSGRSNSEQGVVGVSSSASGVLGSSVSRAGVSGISSASAGVVGHTDASASAGVAGVADGDSVGVFGTTESDNWPGVLGASSINNGVRGVTTAAGEIAGVVGVSANGVGVAGITNSSSSWGGAFFGGLSVSGDLVVAGFKSAAVRHADGSHRLLYAVESPQCWFEDFGRAKLVRGAARVMLDPDFSAVVRTDDYHVFLSPEGDSKGLYVSSRTRTGFQVREQDQGTGSVAFSYRLVARRKDVAVRRFQKIELPAIQRAGLLATPKAISRVTVPQLPALPKAPRLPKRKAPPPG